MQRSQGRVQTSKTDCFKLGISGRCANRMPRRSLRLWSKQALAGRDEAGLQRRAGVLLAEKNAARSTFWRPQIPRVQRINNHYSQDYAAFDLDFTKQH